MNQSDVFRVLSPMTAAAAIARCTARPVVVTTDYLLNGRDVSDVRVLMLLDSQFAGDDFIPADAHFLRRDELPASRFETMAADVRQRYQRQYGAWLLHRVAQRLGKDAKDLAPHVDYDPVAMAADVERWATGRAYLE